MTARVPPGPATDDTTCWVKVRCTVTVNGHRVQAEHCVPAVVWREEAPRVTHYVRTMMAEEIFKHLDVVCTAMTQDDPEF